MDVPLCFWLCRALGRWPVPSVVTAAKPPFVAKTATEGSPMPLDAPTPGLLQWLWGDGALFESACSRRRLGCAGDPHFEGWCTSAWPRLLHGEAVFLLYSVGVPPALYQWGIQVGDWNSSPLPHKTVSPRFRATSHPHPRGVAARHYRGAIHLCVPFPPNPNRDHGVRGMQRSNVSCITNASCRSSSPPPLMPLSGCNPVVSWEVAVVNRVRLPKRTLFLRRAVWETCLVVEYCNFCIADQKPEARVTCIEVVVAY